MRNLLYLICVLFLGLVSCGKSNSSPENKSSINLLNSWKLEYTISYTSDGKSTTLKDIEKTTYTFSKDSLRIRGEKTPGRWADEVFGDRENPPEQSPVPFYIAKGFWISSDNKKLTISHNYQTTYYDILELSNNKLIFKSTNGNIEEYHFNLTK